MIINYSFDVNSALDAESERIIQESLDKISKGSFFGLSVFEHC